MPIAFSCPQCGHKITARDERAGTKGKCSQCGTILTIPSRQAASPTKPSPAKAGPGSSEKIKIRCPKCTGEMRAPVHLAGQVSKCPHCGVSLRIPQKPARKPSGGAASASGPRQRPTSNLSAGLTPLDDASGLTPLDDASGLTPLDDATGLTPLDDLSGLTPLDDPFGSAVSMETGAPAGGSPFGGGLGAAGGSLAGNPYRSPAAAKRRRSSGGSSNAVVMAPAIAMICVASITLLLCIFNAIRLFTGAAVGGVFGEFGNDPERVAAGVGFFVGVLLVVAIPIIVNTIVIFGSIKMMRRENWGLALTAGILMIVPCNFFCLGIPMGIWAVVVLSQSHIRNTFS